MISFKTDGIHFVEGFVHFSDGYYEPYLYESECERKRESDDEPFRLKIIGQIGNIDTGAFSLLSNNGRSVQCRIKRVVWVDEGVKLGLDVDSDHFWANAQNWHFNNTKPVVTRGQIFCWNYLQEVWVDTVDLPRTKQIKVNFEENQAAKAAKWQQLYDNLLDLELSSKEARKYTRLPWVETEEFIRFLQALRIRHPSEYMLRKAEKAFAKKYVEDVLGIGCCRLFGAQLAISRYLQEIAAAEQKAKLL